MDKIIQEKKPSCILCNISNLEPLYKLNEFEIIRCNSCKLLFKIPLPSLEELENFYKEPLINFDEIEKFEKDRRETLEGILCRLQKYKTSGKLLDVVIGK